MRKSLAGWLAILVMSTLAGGTGVARADTYPVRPIRLVVPFPAGGVNDLAARLLAARMGESLGQQMVVENRAGAAGRIGAEVVSRASPDGHTLLFGMSMTHGMASASQTKPGFDPIRDFTPLAPLYWYSAVLICRPAVPFSTVQELIAHAKVHPGVLTYSSAGIGSGVHFFAERFSAMAGIRMLHVPYKGGAPALQAVLAGEVDCTFDGAAKPHIERGAVKAFATTGLRRDALYPDLPTLDEAGLSGFDMKIWQGLFAPRGVPGPVAEKLRAAIHDALGTPAVAAQAHKLGLNPLGGDADELARLVVEEVRKYQTLASDLRISFE